MRIGIVTQPLYANYGGILQNYALQQVLKQMGHDPVTLDYMPSLSFGRYILYAGKGLLCALSTSKRHPIKPYHHFLQRPANIDLFIRSNINLTKTVPEYSRRLLEKNGIEALIVGSDQVWRYSYNSHYLEDMYLAFAKDYPCRKIAYAASFGVEKWDYPDAKALEARALIKQFNAVSVREISSAVLIKDNLGTEADVVLDPTLLLEAGDYERFISKPDPSDAPYLAAYILDDNEEKNSYIEALAKAMNLSVKSMTVSASGCSIEEWLSTIKNAELVITDSYHGSLFSILFGKQFQTFVNKERGADRFYSLFGQLGLQDRLLESPTLPLASQSVIDYSTVSLKLQNLRERSLSYLESALSNN